MQMSILNNVDYRLCIHRPTVTRVWHATSACNLHHGKGQLVLSLRSSSRPEAPVITATSTVWLLFIYWPGSLPLSITDNVYRISSAVHENARYAFGRRLHGDVAAATYSKHYMCLLIGAASAAQSGCCQRLEPLWHQYFQKCLLLAYSGKRLHNAEELVKRKSPMTLKIFNHPSKRIHCSGLLPFSRPAERPAETDRTNPLVWWRVLQFEANRYESLCMLAPLPLILLFALLPTPRVSPIPRLLHL